MIRLIIKLILTLVFTCFVDGKQNHHARLDTLKLVQVIFRHGDRAPTKMYPNDPYRKDFEKLWPEGIAQLTNIGKRQQYELGQFLRQRYDGFLGKTYNPKDLYVTSSDMDRTIMSLESNLAGLFPPVVNPWNPELQWQPIPLRTIPRTEDKYLHNYVKCPKYKQLRSDFFQNSPIVLEMNEKHQDFIQYCAKHSGMEITTVKGLYPLLDILYAQHSHNYTLPQWAQGETLQKLLDIHGVVNTWPTFTDEMKRLAGGPLLKLLLDNIKAFTGAVKEHDLEIVHSVHLGIDRKLVMYSAHDSTLTRIMNTMGVFEPHCPPYASALLIELHQDSNSLEYFIEIHYRNNTGTEPLQLVHPKCGSTCALDDYLSLTHHLVPKNWERECHNEIYKDVGDYSQDDVDTDEEASHVIRHNVADEILNQHKMLKSVAPNYKFIRSTIPSACYPGIFELVMIGIGLIAAFVLLFILIVASVKCHSRKGFVFAEKLPVYREQYEVL